MHDCADLLIKGHCDFMLVQAHDAVSFEIDPVRFPSNNLAADLLVPVSIPGDGKEPRFQFPGSAEAPIPYLSYTTEHFMGKATNFVCHQYGKPRYLDIK